MDGSGRRSFLRRVADRVRRGSEETGPGTYAEPPIELESRLVDAHWADAHTLELSGWVYAPGASVTAESAPGLGLRLENPAFEVVAEATVATYADPAVNEDADDARHDYSGAAFEADLDLRPLHVRDDGPWTLVFSLDTDEGPVTAPFAARDLHGPAGALGRPGATSGFDQALDLRLDWGEPNGLVVHHDTGVGDGIEADLPLVATGVEVDAARSVLLVTGEATSSAVVLELRGPRQTVRTDPLAVTDGRFRGEVPLQVPDWYDEDRPLLAGTYFLHAELDGTPGGEVPMSPACLGTIGERVHAALFHARVERTRRDGVRLRIEPPLRDDERGAFAQMRLRREYHAMPPPAEQDGPAVAYYECYYGVSCTDSARAIQDELVRRGAPVRHVWGVADLSVPVPDGAEAVLRHSREWWQTLGRASYLTFNAGLPAGLVRRPGQVLVQTWHGTPLKLLGHDRPVNHDKPGFEESTSRYVSRWDHLLAGNPHSAEAFRRAWFYEGSVLELGYPRNDALVDPDPAYVEGVRERLGIAPGLRVVLYAPTWRDGTRVMPELLDLERLADALPDHVLLVRGHMNITRWKHRPDGAAILDVTGYPEINDLFLLADVAVTDYSSIMFDYSVTRKPMVFFVPDLDDYRDRRRGVYFDLAESAPGPLLGETDEVVDFLRGLDAAAYEQEYGARYAAWVERFNPLDDGRAAARVVDAVYRLP